MPIDPDESRIIEQTMAQLRAMGSLTFAMTRLLFLTNSLDFNLHSPHPPQRRLIESA